MGYLTGEEFQDLQNFGKTLEKKQNEYSERTSKERQGSKEKFLLLLNKPKDNLNAQKLKYFVIKISKRIIFTKMRLTKHGEFFFFKIQKMKRIKIEIPKQQKNYVKCYCLIEKRKQKRNKTIIVRKRIPMKINIEDIGPARSGLGNLIHLTFESGIYYNHRKTTADHKLKESLWDFKLKN